MSINSWTFTGRLGRDAETRFTQSGKEVTSTAVAVDQGWGENKKTMWVDAVIFGERGGKIAQYLTKGTKVTVTGEADLNTYTAKDGTEKASLRCLVRDIDFGSGQQQKGQTQQQRPQRTSQAAPAQHDPFDSDEIPF